MRWRWVVIVAAGVAAAGGMAGGVAAGAAGPVTAAGSWRHAIEVPALGTLNAGDAEVLSVSCAAAGNCAAGGFYAGGAGRTQAFVASERNGRWGTAGRVPGLAALNVHGPAQVSQVSCPSAGSCAAGGFYTDGSFHTEAFVAVERSGRWGRAAEVPGSAALNAGGFAQVSAVSCASAGNCAAGGFYRDGSRDLQAFAATERNGRWDRAAGVPGLRALNAGGNAAITSVSCPAAGSCAAGGFYRNGSGLRQAFVVSERGGRWGRAATVLGLRALSPGGFARVSTVSCGSAGNCAAGGLYSEPAGVQAFVASERNGRWAKAIQVPGSGALNTGADAVLSSVSCASAGNCAGRRDLQGRLRRRQSHRGVRGRRAERPVGQGGRSPRLRRPQRGRAASVNSVSCPPAGSCAAGGQYKDGSSNIQGFVVSQS